MSVRTQSNLSQIPHYCNAQSDCIYHWHLHLELLLNQTSYVVIPSLLGHINDSQYNLYAMHTHDHSGIIHIGCCDLGANASFTLGEIFKVWGYPRFDSTDCLTFQHQPVRVYINGELWTGGLLSQIPLKQHEEIAVVIGTIPLLKQVSRPAILFLLAFRSRLDEAIPGRTRKAQKTKSCSPCSLNEGLKGSRIFLCQLHLKASLELGEDSKNLDSELAIQFLISQAFQVASG